MNSVIKENELWINKVWEKVNRKLIKVAKANCDKIPYTTVEGKYDNQLETAPYRWTNGFWGGMMWLMYKGSGEEIYRTAAEKSEELLDRAYSDFNMLNHDVGFMWHIVSGASYRLTGNIKSYQRNMYAASLLASRYNIDGGFIRAWNQEGTEGWTIIDCLMNLPLLYWADAELGDNRFRKIALKHTDMAVRDHIRPDGSTAHIVEHNSDTGEVVRIHGGQGYSPSSCWTRGLSWALYGMTLAYIYGGKAEYLEVAERVAEYYIKRLEEYDWLTPIDFDSPKEPLYYDSTAGMCAACGFLELGRLVGGEKAERYTKAAINILKAADKKFCDYSDSCEAIVLLGSERYPHMEEDKYHLSIIYGDFFFIEALLKLRGDDFLIW